MLQKISYTPHQIRTENSLTHIPQHPSSPNSFHPSTKDLLTIVIDQRERVRTSVTLGATDSVVYSSKITVGDQVCTGLVAGWGNRLRDVEFKTRVVTGDPESTARIGAWSSPFADVGQGTIVVCGHKSGAVHAGGFVAVWLEDVEGVAWKC